jgi:serine/threonine protein phosphatase PrpC
VRIRRAVHLSQIGANRKCNEDAVLTAPDVPIFGVADGTGGPESSQAVIRQLVKDSGVLRDRGQRIEADSSTANRLAIGQFFETLFGRASEVIREHMKTDPSGDTARQRASSAVAATVVDRFAYIAHVGDVRAYLYRDGELRCLTSDDTLAMLQLERNEITLSEYSTSPFRHTLTQALGVSQVLDVHTAEVRLQSADIILLCSNGLTRMLKDPVIHQVIRSHSLDLEKVSQVLVERACSNGSQDNVSVVLFQVTSSEKTEPMAVNVVDVVQQAYFFNRLSPTQWLAVAPYLEEISVQAREVIYDVGEPGDEIFILASGTVLLEREDGSTREISPGQHFGAVCLANPSARTERAFASSEAHVFSFSRRALSKIVTYKPGLGARISLTLSEVLGAQLTEVYGRMTTVREALVGWAIPPSPASQKTK